MNKRLRLPMALALALGSSSAFALGLGQIEVKSALNQPLSAEIPVLSSVPGEAEALQVKLASPDAFARIGLDRPVGLTANLQFAVKTNARGQTVIEVTTPDKVADPFLSFLLEVDWGKGRMLREYTVLLDPPTMAPVRGAPAAVDAIPDAPVAEPEALSEAPPPPPMDDATPVEASAPPTTAPSTETYAPPQADPDPLPADLAASPTPSSAPSVDPGSYGPVAPGETLWSIAQRARPDTEISMDQMMLAVLYANPDAFIDQNINRLRAGAILRIPGREEALNLAAAEAATLVREQAQAWRQAVGAVPQPAEAEQFAATPGQEASGTSTPSSRLELVPPQGDGASGAQSGASVDGEGSELRAELARAREQVGALSQENVELTSRVGELERIQGDSQRLIELKDSELAAAQQRLRELEARAAALPPESTSAATDGSTPSDASVPPLDASVEAAPDALPTDTQPLVESPDVAATDSPTLEPGASDTSALPVEDAPTSETSPAPDVTEEPVTEPVAEPLPERPPPAPWYAMLLNPYVIGGLGLVLVGLIALMLSRRRAAASDSSPLRYDSSKLASAMAATQASAAGDELGDDERLERLVAAVAREPANLARHLDLVRFYYETGDAAGFENAAEAMYTRVYDPDDLSWKQVLAMGREIAPEHPLFVTNFDPPVDPIAHASASREIEWGTSSAAMPDTGTTQQMRVDDVKAARAQTSSARDLPQSPPKPVSSSFNFEPARTPVEPPPGESDAFIDADAASTKLELARAYLDMGDVEGARGMLEEVVNEGNPGQRAEAKRLLDEIR